MKVHQTEISGVLLLEPRTFSDDRGFFLESWNRRTFETIGLDEHFVQDNHSHSVAGALRGLHYQVNCPQGKLVRVTRGAVFDVAVDLRSSSPTFGRWVGRELSAANRHLLWIPPGFAHGFYVKREADFLYKCTEFYDPDDERTILWNDPDLAIDWPVPAGEYPSVSSKDAAGQLFRDAERVD